MHNSRAGLLVDLLLLFSFTSSDVILAMLDTLVSILVDNDWFDSMLFYRGAERPHE